MIFVDRWKVHLGDYNLNSKEDDENVQEFKIEEIFIHPKYVSKLSYFDIAVLRIPPVTFTTYVRPICLPK